MNVKDVVYIYSEALENACNRLPTMLNRASIVQDLIMSYGLLHNDNMSAVKSLDATEDELKLFHSTDYIKFLQKVNNVEEEDLSEFEEEQVEFGLGYDCPMLERIYEFAQIVAGGSLTAAKLLAAQKCKIAINWCGGWHHAQRDSAEGFCYVNDIVLAIQKLSESFKKILYLDLDVHHGNGVQNAFEMSPRILTLSFHKQSPGFYPGSGSLDEIGSGKGKHYSINVPFLEGLSPRSYLKAFHEIFPRIFEAFKPEALVVQCGADTLYEDKIGECNLSSGTIGECVKKILEYRVPTLFLGGGGYNFANTARLWTYLTSIIIGQDLDEDIPDSCEYFTIYKPTYELFVPESLFVKDQNDDIYLKKIVGRILDYCNFIQ